MAEATLFGAALLGGVAGGSLLMPGQRLRPPEGGNAWCRRGPLRGMAIITGFTGVCARPCDPSTALGAPIRAGVKGSGVERETPPDIARYPSISSAFARPCGAFFITASITVSGSSAPLGPHKAELLVTAPSPLIWAAWEMGYLLISAPVTGNRNRLISATKPPSPWAGSSPLKGGAPGTPGRPWRRSSEKGRRGCRRPTSRGWTRVG
jgi:hypothetical protein